MKTVNFDIFRKNLKNLMDSSGYMGKYVAKCIEITPASMSRYLQGKRNPDLIYVVKLADFFGVSMEWLLGMSEKKSSDFSEDAQNVMKLYRYASQDERRIIHELLRKYEVYPEE